MMSLNPLFLIGVNASSIMLNCDRVHRREEDRPGTKTVSVTSRGSLLSDDPITFLVIIRVLQILNPGFLAARVMFPVGSAT